MKDARVNLAWPRRGAIWPALAAVSLAACSGGDKTGVGDAKLPQGAQALAHEDCSESGRGVEVLDMNGDGKADIRRVSDKTTGRELCRVADLNHDGKPDLYEYFDANGTIRRREYCYDDTGVVNAIESYDGGKLIRREYDTSGQHRIDTWDAFDPNAPVDPKTHRPAHPLHRERDTNGDGKADQWWTWEGTTVTIAYDRNGDGRPDPENTVVLGAGDDAGAPPASPQAPPASDGGGAATASSTSGGPSSDAGAPTAASAAADGGRP